MIVLDQHKFPPTFFFTNWTFQTKPDYFYLYVTQIKNFSEVLEPVNHNSEGVLDHQKKPNESRYSR